MNTVDFWKWFKSWTYISMSCCLSTLLLCCCSHFKILVIMKTASVKVHVNTGVLSQEPGTEFPLAAELAVIWHHPPCYTSWLAVHTWKLAQHFQFIDGITSVFVCRCQNAQSLYVDPVIVQPRNAVTAVVMWERFWNGVRPGRKFLMMFPPRNDVGANVSHQVTIIATDARTSVTVEVLESCFMRHIFPSPSDSKIVHLPPSVEITSNQGSIFLPPRCGVYMACYSPRFTLLPQCLWPQPPSWCVLLGDPLLSHYSSNKTAVSQMVITNTEQETSVDIFFSGDVHFKGTMYPEGSVLQLHIGVLQSVYLWSSSSLSGSELNSQKVVLGFTCSTVWSLFM